MNYWVRQPKWFVETCMDIRRGENVLIVCDPTTGDIGQALHEATVKKSERVLLIVMPKAKHHGEEPPTPVANLGCGSNKWFLPRQDTL